MAKNNAALYDVNTLIAAGINPQTGLPIKLGSMTNTLNLLPLLEEMDRQDFVNKGSWYNLPSGLDGELIERILYYRGQGAFFYMKTNDTFYFLPYALSEDIDVYGRYKSITPVVFGGSDKDDKIWIPGLKKNVAINLEEYDANDWYDNYCVLLTDRSKGVSQNVVSRQSLNHDLLVAMSEAIPMLRTNLLSNSGIKGMRVQSEADAVQVNLASKSITDAALNGKPWVPIVGTVEFQEMTNTGVMRTEEYLSYFQALDNLRMKTHGFESGGVFEKKSQMLQDEASLNASQSSRVMDDTVRVRQEFCTLVNIIWGLSIWYEPNLSSGETGQMSSESNDTMNMSSDTSDGGDQNV